MKVTCGRCGAEIGVRDRDAFLRGGVCQKCEEREIEAEQAFERRAAFGPGQTVVDITTGKKYRT